MERDDGTYCQKDIIGNHVAVVEEGRAGHEVAIRDAKAKPGGGQKMVKKSILHRMFAAFAKDAEPDEVREAARAVDEAEGGKESEAPAEEKAADYKAVMDAVEALNAKVDALAKSTAQDDEPEAAEEPAKETEAIDALEEELKSGEPAPTEDDESEEESATVSPEALEEDAVPAPKAAEPQPAPTADKALALAVVRTMKPFIAAMPAEQRKKASDALTRTLKKAMQTETQPLSGGYGAFMRRKTADAVTRERELRAYGENCRKRNPHCKKEEK